MKTHDCFSRRAFLAMAAASPIAASTAGRIPVGLELFSVREELAADLTGTVRAVAGLGYDGVEFFSPYFKWTTAEAKDMRKLLDDLGIRCFSTHNSHQSFKPENLPHAIEINNIIGSEIIVMASAGKVEGLDGWKRVAASLTAGAEKMKAAGLQAGYHNHQTEFELLDGTRPIELIAAETPKDVVLQLDVGTCVHAGQDPVAWIEKNPGRIQSIHCKDWSSKLEHGYRTLLGDGDAPWKKIFAAAETTGGIKSYLVEQEGSDYPPMETARRCLDSFRKLHG